MGEPGFWDDQAEAARISTEHARLTRKLERYEALRREVDDAAELLELDRLSPEGQRARARLGLRGVVVVREAVEAAPEDLPDEEAPPRLEHPDVPRCLRSKLRSPVSAAAGRA